MENELTNGAIEDPRPIEEIIENDHGHERYLAAGISSIVWNERTAWTQRPRRWQSISGSCGPQAMDTIMESFTGVSYSANPLYKRRWNFPGYGMYEQDVCDIAKNKKTCLEALSPSQGMTDDQMNAATFGETDFGIGNYYIIFQEGHPIYGTLDMDFVAKALEGGHGLLIRLKSTGEEWQAVPVANPNSTDFFYHFVASVAKNYGLHKGEKAICIQDSCNAFSTINGTGQRILTESFMKERVLGIRGIMPAETPTIDPLKFEEILKDIKAHDTTPPSS